MDVGDHQAGNALGTFLFFDRPNAFLVISLTHGMKWKKVSLRLVLLATEPRIHWQFILVFV